MNCLLYAGIKSAGMKSVGMKSAGMKSVGMKHVKDFKIWYTIYDNNKEKAAPFHGFSR